MNTNETLKLLKKVTEKKSAYPILESICCNGKWTVSNLETTIICQIPQDLETPLEGCFGFNACMNSVNIGDFLLTKNAELTDYPTIDERFKNESSFEVSAKMLLRSLQEVEPYAYKTLDRYNINSIFFDKNRIVATDGHRLITKNIKLPSEAQAIVPLNAINKLMSALKISKSDSVEISFSKDKVCFDLLKNSTTICSIVSRLVDAHYPPYESIIPKSKINLHRITSLDVKAVKSLIASIKRKTHALLFKDNVISFHEQEKKMQVGAYESEISDGERVIDAKFLLGLYELSPSFYSENLRSPFFEEIGDYQIIIMPIRLE